MRGTYNLIAKKVGCTRKYVGIVLENKLGKYDKRETELVKMIREYAAKITEMFEN